MLASIDANLRLVVRSPLLRLFLLGTVLLLTAMTMHRMQLVFLQRRNTLKVSELRKGSPEFSREWGNAIVEDPTMVRDVSLLVAQALSVGRPRSNEGRIDKVGGTRHEDALIDILEESNGVAASSAHKGRLRGLYTSERAYLLGMIFASGLAGYACLIGFLVSVALLRKHTQQSAAKQRSDDPTTGMGAAAAASRPEHITKDQLPSWKRLPVRACTRLVARCICCCEGVGWAVAVVVVVGGMGTVGCHHFVSNAPYARALSVDLALAVITTISMMACYAAVALLAIIPLGLGLALPTIVGTTIGRVSTIMRERHANLMPRMTRASLLIGAVCLVVVITFVGSGGARSSVGESIMVKDPANVAGYLFTTVTGPNFDLCASVSPTLRSNRANAIVWPDVLPRRTLNFFMGTEMCSDAASLSSNAPFGPPGVSVTSRYVGSSGHSGTSPSDFNVVAVDPNAMEAAEHAYWDELPIAGTPTVESRAIEERALLGFAIPGLLPTKTPPSTSPTVEVPPSLRRLFPRPGRRFSDFDENTGELLVAATCSPVTLDNQFTAATPVGEGGLPPPTVIVEDLDRNHVGLNRLKLDLPGQELFRTGSVEWVRYVSGKYCAAGNCPPQSSKVSLEAWRETHPLWSFPDRTFSCATVSLSKKPQIHWNGTEDPACIVYTRGTQVGEDGSRTDSVRTTVTRVEQVLSAKIYSLVQPNYAPVRALAASTFTHPYDGRKLQMPVATLPVPHFRIPLWSASVSILCEGGVEEVHVHPLVHNTRRSHNTSTPAHFGGEESGGSPSRTVDRRHTNLIWLMTDAVSRQDVRRNLPRVQAWIRHMHQLPSNPSAPAQVKGFSAPVGAWELKGATTIGHSTAGNFVPAIAGTPDKVWDVRREDIHDAAARTNLFALLKKQRLQRIIETSATSRELIVGELTGAAKNDAMTDYLRPTYTAMLGTSCQPVAREMVNAYGADNSFREDILRASSVLVPEGSAAPRTPEALGFHFPPSAEGGGTAADLVTREGFIGSELALDHDMFFPLCHRDVGGVVGNSQGPYSIVRRCLGERHSHDHVLPYLEELLVDLLLRSPGRYGGGWAGPRIFAQVTLMEGHEGSHTVVGLADRALYRFLRRLELVWGFFAENHGEGRGRPRGTVLLSSDHGNHMGPFYEWTVAGQMERTTPFVVFAGNSPASSAAEQAALEASLTCPTTAVDLYLTLGKLLGVEAESNASTIREYRTVAKTLMDPRRLQGCKGTGPVSCETFGAGAPCTLSFCNAQKKA